MSRELYDLDSAFKDSVKVLIRDCSKKGVVMAPFFTLRTPFKQAELWRQSRSWAEIKDKIDYFKLNEAHFLAHCLESVGRQYGREVTKALPGYSWHQWGEAVDCYWSLSGKAEWSEDRFLSGVNGYRVYRETAIELGLHPGPVWDWPHIQKTNGRISSIYTVQEVNDYMEDRFKI